jgi:hypothetical protein
MHCIISCAERTGTVPHLEVMFGDINRKTSSSTAIIRRANKGLGLGRNVWNAVSSGNCGVFHRELHKFESLCEFIQRICTEFWTVIIYHNIPSFIQDNYGSVTSNGNATDVPPAVNFSPMLRSIFSITFATVAKIRVLSSTTFAGKGFTNTRSLSNLHEKRSRGVRSRERGGHAIGAALSTHRPGSGCFLCHE